MIDCEHAQRLLGPHADGELHPAQQREIESHLQSCPACQEASTRLHRLNLLVRGATLPPIPDRLVEGIMAQARRKIAAPQVSPQRWRNPLRWWISTPVPVRLAAAASVMVGLATGTLLGQDTWKGLPGRESSVSQTGRTNAAGVYFLDYLSDSPGGSLADEYLRLVSIENGGGR